MIVSNLQAIFDPGLPQQLPASVVALMKKFARRTLKFEKGKNNNFVASKNIECLTSAHFDQNAGVKFS